MRGYETQELREQHVAGLIREREGVETRLARAQERRDRAVENEDAAEAGRLDAALAEAEKQLQAINRQLRIFAGSAQAPAKRAERRTVETAPVAAPAQTEGRRRR